LPIKNRTLENVGRFKLENKNNPIQVRKDLEKLLGASNVSSNFFNVPQSCLDEVTKKVFGMEKLEEFIVARPRNISQIQKIVQYANKNRIYIFVRGGGSGYFGGELPTRRGIVIGTTALNRIREFDQEDGYVVCEAGATVQNLNNFLKKRKFFWPHNPGSRISATIGGSISSLGVGTFSARFGYASDSVLSLKIVTPVGDIVELGSNMRHDMSSYNLLDLISSAEGTLGIIVEAKLKVFPIPRARRAKLFFFNYLKDAIRTAQEIIVSGIYPESLEIEDVRRFTLEGLAPIIDIKSERVRKLDLQKFQAVLFANCSGSKEIADYLSSQIELMASKNHARKPEDQEIMNLYWRSKTEVTSWATKENTTFKVHTCVPAVPLSKVPRLEKIYWRLSKKYPKLIPMGVGYYIIIQNHECTVSARIKLDESNQDSIHEYELFTADLSKEVMKLGGTPASTFGVGTILVGIAKKHASPSWLDLSSKLRHAIDPSGILSPDKKGW
jgi:FAD/FMN-containing dehydrogenase